VRKNKPKILIFADYYLPGYKSGGGMRTIVNMVDRLHEKYDFWIVTRDHDGKLDKTQYTTVKINEWNEVRNAQVFYLDKKSIKLSKLRELILQLNPDILYMNSYFATLAIFVMKLRKFRQIPHKPVVIAPCGELSEGALKFKSLKKQLFLNYAKLTNLYSDVVWKASAELEMLEIEKVKYKQDKIIISADMPPKIILENYQQEVKPQKIQGEAKMIFLSRFMRKKNFKWLLENLGEIKGNLQIDIYGPIEDEFYWDECKQIIAKLPKNIQIQAKGSIPHEEVPNKLLEYQYFILPTLGENFGHIFIESLAAGCPLIISDRTPWLDLEESEIGWAIPLSNPQAWNKIINECIALGNDTYQLASSKARSFVVNWLNDSTHEQKTIEVLEYALSKVK
jgi:glycosyltransferase involved in cell wall biosynthesis